MARQILILVFIVVSVSVSAADTARTPEVIDSQLPSAPQTTWQNCHDAMMSKIHAIGHDLPLLVGQGMSVPETTRQYDDIATPTTEGIACTWEEVFAGLEVCISNWRQLNKTLTPANEVARASANLRAKGYTCGLESSEEGCESIPHCRWNADWGMCPLSNFYFTLQFACHASPVRKVSICIDFAEEACSADGRCKWHGFPNNPNGDVCLPADTPADWTVQQIDSWLINLFNDEKDYYTNWGDCATSHAWAEVTACGTIASADGCAKDENCIWIAALNTCTLNPDRLNDVMWGGDMKTVEAVQTRHAYCNKLRSADACVRAMPTVAARRLLEAKV